MATTINTSYAVTADTLSSESGVSIENGTLHVYNNDLKAHLNDEILGISTYKTEVINISSAQILGSQTTPIDLLPAAGEGKYYDIERIILEYTHVTTPYTLTGGFLIKDNGGYFNKELYNFSSEGANTVVLLTNWMDAWATGASATTWQYGYQVLNSGFQFTTTGGTPTLGDGTLRVIITYKTRTFGA